MVEAPFTEETLRDLKRQEENLKEAKTLIERAKRGGFDVTDPEKRVGELQERLVKIKRAFFPGQ